MHTLHTHAPHTHTQNSYLPVIGVHEMHGRMHPNYWQITILLVVDLYSLLAYFMMIQPLPIAGKLPIQTLVAKQLPTHVHTHTHTHTHKLSPFPLHQCSKVITCLYTCGFIIISTNVSSNHPMQRENICTCEQHCISLKAHGRILLKAHGVYCPSKVISVLEWEQIKETRYP